MLIYSYIHKYIHIFWLWLCALLSLIVGGLIKWGWNKILIDFLQVGLKCSSWPLIIEFLQFDSSRALFFCCCFFNFSKSAFLGYFFSQFCKINPLTIKHKRVSNLYIIRAAPFQREEWQIWALKHKMGLEKNLERGISYKIGYPF